MKINIGITASNLEKGIKILSIVLADEVTLYTKKRKFHWNVTGESFMELHQLFEDQYKQLEAAIDEVAERIGKLGGKAIGTMHEFGALTKIKESPNTYPNQKEMLQELLNDHETIIVQLRKDVSVFDDDLNDAGTADFLTGLIEKHETMAWILRRYLS